MKTLLVLALTVMPGMALAHKTPIDPKRMPFVPEAKLTVTDTQIGRTVTIPGLTSKTCLKKAHTLTEAGAKATCRVERAPLPQKPKPITAQRIPGCDKSPVKIPRDLRKKG